MPTPKDEVPVPAPSGAQPRAARKPKGKGKGNGDEKQEGAKERAAAERLETSLANAQKALDQLAEVNANVLWRGIVRSNELDRRTSKASTCERDMPMTRLQRSRRVRQRFCRGSSRPTATASLP